MTFAPSTPSPPLEQLLYESRCLIDADSALQMSDILAEARPANARDGITGALTAVDGRFIQVIEGEAEALDRLMARLERDRRHTGIIVRERRPVGRRAFADWDMVSPRLNAGEMTRLSALLKTADAGLDLFIGVLAAAVAAQDAMLRGEQGPGSRSRGAQTREGEPGEPG